MTATMTERRIKALVTVVAADYGRLVREGDVPPDAAIGTLDAIGRQRTAEAGGADPMITTYIPASVEEREKAGITDVDVVEAVEYCTTPRGRIPTPPTSCAFSGLPRRVGFDAFRLAEVLLTQPLLVVGCDTPGAFGSHRGAGGIFRPHR